MRAVAQGPQHPGTKPETQCSGPYHRDAVAMESSEGSFRRTVLSGCQSFGDRARVEKDD